MKKLFLSIISAFTAFAVTAATVIYAPAGSSAGSSILANQPLVVNKIDIANATTNAATVTFFDAPGSTLTFTTGAYTGRQSYTTNVVTSWTAITGVTYTDTNTVVYTVPVTVAAATNSFRILNTIVVPANSTASWIPTGFGGYAGFGLAATNNVAVTATVNYSNPR